MEGNVAFSENFLGMERPAVLAWEFIADVSAKILVRRHYVYYLVTPGKYQIIFQKIHTFPPNHDCTLSNVRRHLNSCD